jgi:hypothetical protein
MAVALEFEHFERQANVDRRVLVSTVLHIVRLLQRLVGFSNEDQNVTLLVAEDSGPQKNLAQRLASGGRSDLGLCALGVDE